MVFTHIPPLPTPHPFRGSIHTLNVQCKTLPVHSSVGLWLDGQDNRSKIRLLGVVAPVLLLEEVSAVACLHERTQLGGGEHLRTDTHVAVALLGTEKKGEKGNIDKEL